MKRPIKILLFCFCCFAFIGCDRVTKDLAKEHLKNKQPVSYFHNTVQLKYVENTGAALSLGDHLPKMISLLLLSILPLSILVMLFIYTIKNAEEINLLKMFSLSLIFGRGIGNIIDRLFFDRHVPDFIFIEYKNLHTGIFNLADVCVMAGTIGLILFYRDKKPILSKSRS